MSAKRPPGHVVAPLPDVCRVERGESQGAPVWIVHYRKETPGSVGRLAVGIAVHKSFAIVASDEVGAGLNESEAIEIDAVVRVLHESGHLDAYHERRKAAEVSPCDS